MNIKNRQKFATIMRNAWTLARHGAKEFGGSSFEYFKIALLIVWYNENHPSVVLVGGGTRFLLPGMSIKVTSKQSQLLLPGMAL